MRLFTIIGSIQILVTGLVAGILMAILVTAPARLALDSAALIQLQQGMHIIFARMMPPFALTAIISGIIWLITLRGQARSAAFFFAVLSLLFALAGAIVTVTLNFPLNDLLMTWNPASPPANVRELWMPWERYHIIRTSLYMASFICAILANGLTRERVADRTEHSV